MLIRTLLATALSVVFSTPAWSQAMDHTGHSAGRENGCLKVRISNFKPEHLSAVAPGAEYAFTVSNSAGPRHIHTLIRQQPAEVTIEDKETFLQVKGHLPADIKNETVRISVKAMSKVSKCDAEGGFLLKVSD